MGMVYRAEHDGLERKVALKLLAPELAADETFRERFVREARAAAALDHPNVIPIYEAGEHDGMSFIAMRFVEGTDLRELLAEHGPPPNPRRAAEIVAQLGSALDAAHQKGLVHRDVKPGNVLMVRGSNHCYLTDFGLTKATSSQTGFTGTGEWLGTTAYVAPEQIEGKPLDSRSDVYSLTCVLFELLTGSVPYRRDSEVAVMWAHMNEPPPQPTALRGELPGALDSVIAAGMAKQVAERYPSCGALVEDLQAALAGRAPSLTSPSAQPVAAATAAPIDRSARRTERAPAAPPPAVTPPTARAVPPADPDPPAPAPGDGHRRDRGRPDPGRRGQRRCPHSDSGQGRAGAGAHRDVWQRAARGPAGRPPRSQSAPSPEPEEQSTPSRRPPRRWRARGEES